MTHLISALIAFQLHAASEPQESVWTDIWINPGVYDCRAPLMLRIERNDGREPTEKEVKMVFGELGHGL